MKASLILALVAMVCSSLAVPAEAQRARLERDVTKQREAVAAWSACIADERRDEVEQVLLLDYQSDEYEAKLERLAETRISQECFVDLPRRYRVMRLSGLPFAGGLAEHVIKDHEQPLLNRLSMAAIGPEIEAFAYTDAFAICTVRGAPHLVASLFETGAETVEETAALEQLDPVIQICTRGGSAIEASPMAIRAILASASYRILAAQDNATDESEDDA